MFGNQNPIAITKRLIKGLKGIENVYTQHVPLVKQLADQLIKGKLKEANFPFIGLNSFKDKYCEFLVIIYCYLFCLFSNKIYFRPQEIIIFMIGGITYEETLAIYNINKNSNGNYK